MELRLFPLQSVLFPGMELPLQVFEPRYLRLVRECTEFDEPFGAALIREGVEVGGPAVPFDVGTTARVTRLQPWSAHALRIVAVGERRFRIRALHDDRPYLWADVELLDEVAGEVPGELIERASTLLAELERLRAAAGGEYRPREEPLPAAASDAGVLADAIGSGGVGAADERQALLETLDGARRLERAVALLEADLPALRRRVSGAVMRRWSGPGGLN